MSQTTSLPQAQPAFSIRESIGLGLLTIAPMAVLLLGALAVSAAGIQPPRVAVEWSIFGATLVSAGAIWWVVRRRLAAREMSWSDFGFRRVPLWSSVKYIAGFYALMVLLLIVVLVAAWLMGASGDAQSQPRKPGLDALPLWMSLAMSVGIAPIIEEMAFRGALFTALAARYRLALAVLIGGVLFAAIHLDPVRILLLLPMGLYVCWMFSRLGSLWPVIALHASWNLLVTLLRQL